MDVQCELCEKKEHLNDDSPLAKKLRNRPIHTYMCQECHDRISQRTKEHFADQTFNRPHRGTKKIW